MASQGVNLEKVFSNLKPEDLESPMSMGFVVKGTIITYSELIGLINGHLESKPGEKMVYQMISSGWLELKPVRSKKNNESN